MGFIVERVRKTKKKDHLTLLVKEHEVSAITYVLFIIYYIYLYNILI